MTAASVAQSGFLLHLHHLRLPRLAYIAPRLRLRADMTPPKRLDFANAFCFCSRLVGHNVSQRKHEDEAARREREHLLRYAAPGWTLDLRGGRLVAEDTLLGMFRRGQTLVLRCRRADCRRRVEVDLGDAVRAGIGHYRPHELIGTLRCHHYRGCELNEAVALYPHGVPLAAYVGQDAFVVVRCAKCQAELVMTAEQAIDRLRAAGRGDAATGINALATAIRGPCRRCGGRAFNTATK